ncbi:Metallothionein expression activator [Maudiozyma exigua]|uniref:Metallothionein expression activator n=1 Tax=Maudiozyma exigua TaxID=34358 RepID=A0A9P6WAB7_MAUEX|nr:Metallothionein expression activator [Kazachstania exigua]
MDSEIESWLVNPQNVFKDNNSNNNSGNKSSNSNDEIFRQPNFMQDINEESFLNLSNNGSGYDLQNFSKPSKLNTNLMVDNNNFDLQYSDIDNLLTQELKDLDIPMAPSPNENGVDWRQNNIIVTPQQFGEQHSKKPSMTHKRGMSGTAIFGFANHNKTLSISSIQKTIREMSKDPNLNNMISNYNSNSPESMEPASNYNNFAANPAAILNNNKSSNSTNDQLNRMILSQQETLRLELEKQKEMNKKLELQLRENQLQQAKLQQVLEEQEASAQHQQQQLNTRNSIPSNGGSPLRSHIVPQMIQTPARSNRGRGEDDPLIITSNSAAGTYQFPPPSNSPQRSMCSPLNSNTTINGSPSKGYSHGRKRNGLIPNLQLDENSSNDYLKEGSSNIPPIPPAPVFNTYKSPPRSETSSKDKEKFGSPRNFQSKQRSPGMNIPFTPPWTNESATGESQQQSHNKKMSVISSASTIPQQDTYSNICSKTNNGLLGLGISMPTIPGSTETTPIKCKLPQKHTFQHTPIKTLPESTATNGSPLVKQQLMVNQQQQIHQTPNIYERLPAPMEFTPSPIKITKKPSTLPPGSIDQYVKELPDKLFQCLYPGCGKAFKRRYNVRSHIQTHLQDRPYECDFEGCGKAFVRNHDLMRHKHTHEKKPFICPCGKRFLKESAMMSHRSKMICSGSKKYDTGIISKPQSPTKRQDYDNNGTPDKHHSPIKTNIERDKNGYVLAKMDEQLSKDIKQYGLLNPPQEVISRSTPTKNRALQQSNRMFGATPPSSFSDLESP